MIEKITFNTEGLRKETTKPEKKLATIEPFKEKTKKDPATPEELFQTIYNETPAEIGDEGKALLLALKMVIKKSNLSLHEISKCKKEETQALLKESIRLIRSRHGSTDNRLDKIVKEFDEKHPIESTAEEMKEAA